MGQDIVDDTQFDTQILNRPYIKSIARQCYLRTSKRIRERENECLCVCVRERERKKEKRDKWHERTRKD